MNLILTRSKAKILTTLLLFLILGITFFIWACSSTYSVSLAAKCLSQASNAYIPQPLSVPSVLSDMVSDFHDTGCMGLEAYDPSSILASNIVTALFFIFMIIISYVIASVIFLFPPFKKYGYKVQKKVTSVKKRKIKK